MDLQARKIKFVRQFLELDSEETISRLEKLLFEEQGPHAGNADMRSSGSNFVNDLGGTYISEGSTLEEKKKILRQALEEGENSGLVENFDLEKFLQELHRKGVKKLKS